MYSSQAILLKLPEEDQYATVSQVLLAVQAAWFFVDYLLYLQQGGPSRHECPPQFKHSQLFIQGLGS